MGFLTQCWAKWTAWLDAQPVPPSHPLTYEEWDLLTQAPTQRERQEAVIAQCLAQELIALGMHCSE